MTNNYTGQVSEAEAIQTDWFTKRGLKVLNYQTEVLKRVKESLNKREVTIMAACPSAGKTIMAINIIEDYLQHNPTHKVLILAHGTTILRSQFHDVLEEIKPDFKYNLVESFKDYDIYSDVNICLPQTLSHNDLFKTDLVVVDEAHHFYFADMVKNIIINSGAKKQFLLTGTPSSFIYKKYPIVPVTLNTIYDEDRVSDVYVEIATSTYNFDIYDYNQDNELRAEVRFENHDTKNTLDNLLSKIVERLKGFKGNEYINLLPQWLPTLKRLKKTMFACKSQSQARQVKNYFDKIGIKSALSISDDDCDSKEIVRFKKEKDCLILIVVGRGILGFNYPELVNVVDMTTSQNVDRIFQLLCRVIRKHPKGEKKLFFKIAPNMLSDYYKYIMTAVLSLCDEKYFISYNGKNFKDMPIPVIKTEGIKRIKKDYASCTNKRTRKLKPISFEGLPALELFRDILHRKNSLLNVYSFTTLRDVRADFLGNDPCEFWTKEKIKESAMKYQRISDWYKNEAKAYHAAIRKCLIGECTKHMEKKIQWTKEKVMESALKYKKSGDWLKHEKSAYGSAKRNGWMEECTTHMVKKTLLTKENVIKSALKYSVISDWMRHGKRYHKAAQRNGWLDECTKHMKKQRKWTKEKVMESAMKYQSSGDWYRHEKNVYKTAHYHGWMGECTKHMIKTENLMGT